MWSNIYFPAEVKTVKTGLKGEPHIHKLYVVGKSRKVVPHTQGRTQARMTCHLYGRSECADPTPPTEDSG